MKYAYYHYSEWARDGGVFGAANGILGAEPDLTANASRAEIAAYLHRFSKIG